MTETRLQFGRCECQESPTSHGGVYVSIYVQAMVTRHFPDRTFDCEPLDMAQCLNRKVKSLIFGRFHCEISFPHVSDYAITIVQTPKRPHVNTLLSNRKSVFEVKDRSVGY